MSNHTYMQAEFLRRQIEQLMVAYPELTEDDQLMADTLEGETDFRAVMSKLVAMDREANAMAEAVKAQMSQMAERKARWTRKSEAMRSLMHKLMDAATARKLTLPEATISVRNVPPAVQITDENAVPDEYAVYERKIDKAALKKALQYGGSVSGATLGNGSETISIRWT